MLNSKENLVFCKNIKVECWASITCSTFECFRSHECWGSSCICECDVTSSKLITDSKISYLQRNRKKSPMITLSTDISVNLTEKCCSGLEFPESFEIVIAKIMSERRTKNISQLKIKVLVLKGTKATFLVLLLSYMIRWISFQTNLKTFVSIILSDLHRDVKEGLIDVSL